MILVLTRRVAPILLRCGSWRTRHRGWLSRVDVLPSSSYVDLSAGLSTLAVIGGSWWPYRCAVDLAHIAVATPHCLRYPRSIGSMACFMGMVTRGEPHPPLSPISPSLTLSNVSIPIVVLLGVTKGDGGRVAELFRSSMPSSARSRAAEEL